MNKIESIKFSIPLILVVVLLGCNQKPTSEKSIPESNIVQSRIGELEFSHDFANGYPTDKTVQKLYNEMDFQRACQAYLWALPFVSIAEWQYQHENTLGAQDGDFVINSTYQDKLGILTANATTPYVFAIANLNRTGPMVLEMQPGLSAGNISDFWQYSVMDIGAMGPDQCKGGKYLIVPLGSDLPDIEGYYMVRMPSENFGLGIRALMPNLEESMNWVKSLKLYPYSEKNNIPDTKFIDVNGKSWTHQQPRGLAFWERLADMINNEVVREQDRLMMAMLKPLGIEKGKPFNPDDTQKEILIEASLVGEAMAKANTYEKRFDSPYYRTDAHWKYVVFWDWTHQSEHYYQLDELASYTYEAIGTNKAMNSQQPGFGQAYLGAYKDSDGAWLDGSKNYSLHIPPNPPAKQFWSVTLYDVDTRCLINNEQLIGDKSSRMDLLTNEDGSVDLYFGPDQPKERTQNWIPTIPNQGFFAYIRFYAPLKPYFERTWALPDIEQVKYVIK